MIVFKGNSGKLTVYTSQAVLSGKRLKYVSAAAQQTAKRLNLSFEMVRFEKNSSPIYVYYKEGNGDEPVPLYCDEGKMADLEEICSALRNMMFVLSFHPKHSALKPLRKAMLA